LIPKEKFLLRKKQATERNAAKTGSSKIVPPYFSERRCSAHLLWIRLCASTLTLAKYLDLYEEIVPAQKEGKSSFYAEIPYFSICVMIFDYVFSCGRGILHIFCG
jgi:hypothetical protein